MIKNIFLSIVAALFVFYGQIAPAKDVRFVQVTDTHYSVENEFRRQVLKSTINDINTLKNVSFVVFTGDNIDKPKAKDLRAFIRTANKLKVPYYVALGNHDVSRNQGMSKDEYMRIIKTANLFYPTRKLNYSFKKRGHVFIVVDGSKELIPNNNGYYRVDTLDWLEKEIEKHKKSPVVIIQHFPILPPKVINSYATYQADEYLLRLKAHKNVIAVVAGHYHINGEIMQDGVYHITTPTLIKEPYEYKIIDISTAKGFSPMIYTQLKAVELE